MLAQIPDRFRTLALRVLLSLLAAAAVSSCATKKQPNIFAEQQTGKRESSLPWNEQQKWESQGQFGPMAERMGDGRH